MVEHSKGGGTIKNHLYTSIKMSILGLSSITDGLIGASRKCEDLYERKIYICFPFENYL